MFKGKASQMESPNKYRNNSIPSIHIETFLSFKITFVIKEFCFWGLILVMIIHYHFFLIHHQLQHMCNQYQLD